MVIDFGNKDIKEIVEQIASDYITSEEMSEQIQEAVKDKQDELVSGENIKTINNESVLGEGNLAVTKPQVIIPISISPLEETVTVMVTPDEFRVLVEPIKGLSTDSFDVILKNDSNYLKCSSVTYMSEDDGWFVLGCTAFDIECSVYVAFDSDDNEFLTEYIAIGGGGEGGDTEEIEHVTAAAINDLRFKLLELIENMHFSKDEINEKLSAFVSAAELDKYALVTFVSELTTEIYSRIESSELAAAAALNDLNNR